MLNEKADEIKRVRIVKTKTLCVFCTRDKFVEYCCIIKLKYC